MKTVQDKDGNQVTIDNIDANERIACGLAFELDAELPKAKKAEPAEKVEKPKAKSNKGK